MTTARGSRRNRRTRAAPVAGLLIAVALGAIALSQGVQPDRVIGGGAILLIYVAALWVFQDRSETVSTLAGRPADERWQAIHERAAAAAASIGAVVALAGFGIIELLGRESWQFAAMAAALGLAYLGAFFWYRWRT